MQIFVYLGSCYLTPKISAWISPSPIYVTITCVTLNSRYYHVYYDESHMLGNPTLNIAHVITLASCRPPARFRLFSGLQLAADGITSEYLDLRDLRTELGKS